jgi:CoA:oxalate CoA-transferase
MTADRLLNGVVVAAEGEDPATAACLRHLSRLGATVAGADSRVDADVVLVSSQLELIGGGLVASETTTQAALGLTDYIGPAGGHPERTGADVASSVAGVAGAAQVLGALRSGRTRPFSVELSPARALAALKTILWAARTRPDEWTGTHVRSRERDMDSGYATRDGRVTLDFPFDSPERWRSFVGEVGFDDATIARLAPRWYETVGWGDDVDPTRSLYEGCLSSLSRDDAIALIRRHGGSSVPFLTLQECLRHPQALAVDLQGHVDSGLPWRLSTAGKASPIPRDAPTGPGLLSGVRVVDFGIGGVAPYAGTLLAWFGADVVKVEAPNEFIHAVRPTLNGTSTTYLALNQGKRSVSLNLKRAKDRELALELLDGADVLLENFRPGALERLGLGVAEVAERCPHVVYCSATGFGWDGPLAREACTDPHMQAFSGFAAGNADRETGLPRRVRYYGFVDLVTSCVIVEAVCAGLLARDSGPVGAVRVETSMLHAVADAQQLAHGRARATPDGIFATADGYVALTCRDDADWARLVELVDAPELRTPRLADLQTRIAESGRIRAALERVLRALPAAAWAQALGRAGIACARVCHDEEVMARRDLWETGVLRTIPSPYGDLVGGGPPWPTDPGSIRLMAPAPGADTDELRRSPSGFWDRG